MDIPFISVLQWIFFLNKEYYYLIPKEKIAVSETTSIALEIKIFGLSELPELPGYFFLSETRLSFAFLLERRLLHPTAACRVKRIRREI